ncbi:MAG TPA: TIGR03086 family metal-binding protein [Frankiaceae bacterium]|jgi:uncharacterized protein (TIGR03086 family)|nr:TIGR03086 family metal-binding protein [Frankiaceae bacterium]
MNATDLYERTTKAVGELVREVTKDQWEAATPCAAWTVRDLVNHLVGENRWMPALLSGRTIADVGSALDGDLLGDDPIAEWALAVREAKAAVANADLQRIVHLGFGDAQGEEYLMQVAADHLIHYWDLAVAVGAHDDLDASLVESVASWFESQEAGYRQAGAVGPRPELAGDASPQARLLAMFGRRACVLDPLPAVDRFGAAFDVQDVDAVIAAMTPDCVFESTAPPDGVRYEGADAVRAAWTDFFRASTGAQFTTEARFGCGDRVVVRWRYDWPGDDGSDAGHVRGVDIFRVRGGLVAEKVSYVKG